LQTWPKENKLFANLDWDKDSACGSSNLMIPIQCGSGSGYKALVILQSSLNNHWYRQHKQRCGQHTPPQQRGNTSLRIRRSITNITNTKESPEKGKEIITKARVIILSRRINNHKKYVGEYEK